MPSILEARAIKSPPTGVQEISKEAENPLDLGWKVRIHAQKAETHVYITPESRL